MLAPPQVNNNPCHSSIISASSLARRGKGGIPLSETHGFIPPASLQHTIDNIDSESIPKDMPSNVDKENNHTSCKEL